MSSNNCGIDCKFDKNRQEQIRRDQISYNTDIPIYDNSAESRIQDEIAISYVADKIGRIPTYENQIGTQPCVNNRSFLPRFLASAKLPGWDGHSEYVLLECFESEFDLSVEISQENGDLLRAMQVFTTALKHVIDYLGSKIDTGSVNEPKKDVMIKIETSSNPLQPGKTITLPLKDVLEGKYPAGSFIFGTGTTVSDYAQIFRSSRLMTHLFRKNDLTKLGRFT
jgi:hypothetical protein